MGDRPRLGRPALHDEYGPFADESDERADDVVVRPCLGEHGAVQPKGPRQIGPHHSRHADAPAADVRPEPVTDGVGDIAAFDAEGIRRGRVSRHGRGVRLPREDLAQQPVISDCAGDSHRFGEVGGGRFEVVPDDATA